MSDVVDNVVLMDWWWRRWGMALWLGACFALIGCASDGSRTITQHESIEVCLLGQCGPAQGRLTPEQMIGGLLLMFRENENAEAQLCESDPTTKECVKDRLSFYVQGGPIPGIASYGGPSTLFQVGLDKETLQIKFRLAGTARWIGTPVLCGEPVAAVTVASLRDVRIEAPSVLCAWTVFPHAWKWTFDVRFVDLDQSVIAGDFSVKGGGIPVFGWGSGHFVLKLPKRNILAERGGLADDGKRLRTVGELAPDLLFAEAPKVEDARQAPKQVDSGDQELWIRVSREGHPDGYRTYLAQYPDGRFAGTAKANLQSQEAMEKQNRELAAWSQIKDSADPKVFQTHVAEFPGGLFAEVAALKARRLNAAAAEAAAIDAELALWERVKGSTDQQEITTYLDRYPRGQFANLAQERLKKLSEATRPSQELEASLWNQIKDSREVRDYQRYLQAFPNGFFRELAKGRLESLTVLTAQTDELNLWNSVKDGTDPEGYATYLRRYPNGMFAGLAKRLSRQMASLTEERQELDLWESIRDSANPKDFESYVQRYPKGRFLAEAHERKRQAERALSYQGINFGRFHAVVIGINRYQHLPHLATAVGDAKEVGSVLQDLYRYKVTYLLDAHRKQIIDALSGFRKELRQTDNLLIYFAGHGILDKEAGRGYWLAADSERDSPANWISTSDVSDVLKAMRAKHVMIVADSCYSGTLTRDIKVETLGAQEPSYLSRLSEKRVRVALTSGGLEPVLDDGGGGHSVFAKAFLTVLKQNAGVLEGTRLFHEMRRAVVTNAAQTPEYADIRFADHEGGDYLFVRR